MKRRDFLAGLAGTSVLALPSIHTASAQAPRTLRIAAQTAPSGMDPHYHSSNPNIATSKQIFSSLIDVDADNKLIPCLAETWRIVDDKTWEFTLRQNVKFHDGTPFEADDVRFSLERVLNIPNSPGSFAPYARNIAEVKTVSPNVIQIVTKDPNPFLDWDIYCIFILSRRLHTGATLADFNSGKAMIGTGPYKHVSYQIGEQHEIAKNPDYWGTPAAWDRVVTRIIPNAGSRVAALLAGDTDLIDSVGPQDVPRLTADPKIGLFAKESTGVAYLFPDASRDVSPFVFDKQGKPLSSNPLKDVRVRQALSLAINRAGIIERLLSGQGAVADQFAPATASDRAPGLPPLALDIAKAKKLLADAGYPDGFRLTIHGPSGWFAGDQDVLQAVAQGFTRIGVETQVEVLPPSALFSRATNREFSMFMTTLSGPTAANTLRQVVQTYDTATGSGPFNRQRYSNPKIDTLVSEALRTMDPAKRASLTSQALKETVADMPVIPLFFPKFAWATRKSYVTFQANAGWKTTAVFAEPAK